MTATLTKIGFGGGCHWCTEAVFQSLAGVNKVEQGYIASVAEDRSFSEAVIVHFSPEKISLKTLSEIHLHTHKSTVQHSMRDKYRSGIYVFSEVQKKAVTAILIQLQDDFKETIITKIYPFVTFKASREEIINYYYSNPKKPFCEQFINPKLKILLKKFSKNVDTIKLKNVKNDVT